MIAPSQSASTRAPGALEAEPDQQRQRHEHARQSFGHEQTVVEPEVRVQRGDDRGDHARSPPADLRAEQRHQRHEEGTEQRGDQPVRAEAAARRAG